MINKESNRLFRKSGEGDIQAFEKLFKRLHPRLKDFAVRVVRDNDVAEDIVQEVFIKIWEKRKRIATINIEAFFFRVLRNQCISHIKHLKVVDRLKVSIALQRDAEEVYRIDFVRNEPYILVEKELQDQIDKIIHALPEKCREVFLLSRAEGLKNREIAEKLGINIKNVERHLQRALKSFKSQFGQSVPATLIMLIIRNIYL
jgi:RNA polymerase sigma-70 factor (ECF subfamily)